MKGTLFQRPLELGLVAEGESWSQGDAISGQLTVRSHASSEVPLAGIRVSLAHGRLSAVRKKDPEAFDILESAPMSSPATLPPQGSASLSWRFATDRNCPITDGMASLFLLYGQGDATEKLGQLQLSVVPIAAVRAFLDAITTQFRFVLRSHRWSKGWVETKLDPPDARTFASVEQLSVFSRHEGDLLELRYVFSVSGVDGSSPVAGVKKSKKELVQSFAPHEIRLPSGRWDHGRIEGSIAEVLKGLGGGLLA